MTNWHTLRHAYGEAADIPALLAQISPDPATEAWDELWSRLCHQGTVYSASFAALPPLADIAVQWHPRDRHRKSPRRGYAAKPRATPWVKGNPIQHRPERATQRI